jgi:hypothetical protein
MKQTSDDFTFKRTSDLTPEMYFLVFGVDSKSYKAHSRPDINHTTLKHGRSLRTQAFLQLSSLDGMDKHAE